jgi:Serine/threonine protein kinase
MGSDDQNLVGEQVSTCVLERMIGAGGMGVVYLARQTRPSRHVAVKLLKPSISLQTEAYQEFLARFRREADVIAQLDHINILPIYEYGESNNLAYLIMPYLNGGSLRTLLLDRGRLSPKEALTYLEQATSALQYAHEHKIVHRDIKPANMLFHSDGRLVLVDFGIARIIHDATEQSSESLTRTGNFMGSVEYMAPEMVQGSQVDYRADIYELGVVLYQMLSGHVPFQGTSPFALAAMHIHEIPPTLTALNPTLTPEIDAVVQKALAKDPAARYQSMFEFAAAYRSVVSPSTALLDEETQLASGFAYQPWPTTYGFQSNSGLPSNPGLHPVAGTGTPLDDPTRSGLAQPSPPSPPTAAASTPMPHYPLQSQYPYQPADINTPQYMQANAATPRQLTPQIPVTPHVLPDAGTTYNSANDANHMQPQRQYYQPAARRHGFLPWLVTLVALCLTVVLAFLLYAVVPPLLALRNGQTTPVATPAPQSTAQPTPQSTPAPTPQSTPAPTPSQLASASVQTYFDDINQQDYQSAYQQWDANSDFRKKTSYQDFVNGFANTIHDDVTISDVAQNSDGSYRVDFTMSSTGKSSSGNTVTSYRGYYDVVEVNGQWKLENAQVAQSS